jgi:hypothetical protein
MRRHTNSNEETTQDYYRRRAAEERELAIGAATPELAYVHEKMAKEYEALIRSNTLSPPLKIVGDA